MSVRRLLYDLERAALADRGTEPTARQAAFDRGDPPLPGFVVRVGYPRVRGRRLPAALRSRHRA